MQVPFNGPNSSHVLSRVAVPQSFHPALLNARESVRTASVAAIQHGASPWSISVAKRTLDFSVALGCVLFFALPMLILAICVRVSSNGPALFVQKRVGRGGHLFGVYKFRTMTVGSSSGLGLTKLGDSRITGFGRLMRKFKLDELPQFYNILRGEMSLVGPRPKLARYEPMANMLYRPGITGAATLAFRHEEEILGGIHPSKIDHFYEKHIMPVKAQIDSQYMIDATLLSDMRIVAATFLACLRPLGKRSPFEGGKHWSVKSAG